MTEEIEVKEGAIKPLRKKISDHSDKLGLMAVQVAGMQELLSFVFDDLMRTRRNLRVLADMVRSGNTNGAQKLCDELDRQRQGEDEILDEEAE